MAVNKPAASTSEVRAAGAVLWRYRPERSRSGRHPEDTFVEVAVVHRERYDDWSLPKGKLDPGEHPLVAARREVAEETGFLAVAGRRLPTIRYPVPAGECTAEKTVDYWAMRAESGPFAANEEVDELRWLSVPDATALVSYSHDRTILADFTTIAPDTATVLLVRHGSAGDRDEWPEPDEFRPLDHKGLTQAAQLATALPCFGPTRVFSADKVRCVGTIRPLAKRLGSTVEVDPRFNEEWHAADFRQMPARIRALAGEAGTSVICGQGGAIPDSVAALAAEDGLSLDRVRARKGSVWVLSFSCGRLVAADYFRSFEAI